MRVSLSLGGEIKCPACGRVEYDEALRTIHGIIAGEPFVRDGEEDPRVEVRWDSGEVGIPFVDRLVSDER